MMKEKPYVKNTWNDWLISYIPNTIKNMTSVTAFLKQIQPKITTNVI